jgi:hypothetical protein
LASPTLKFNSLAGGVAMPTGSMSMRQKLASSHSLLSSIGPFPLLSISSLRLSASLLVWLEHGPVSFSGPARERLATRIDLRLAHNASDALRGYGQLNCPRSQWESRVTCSTVCTPCPLFVLFLVFHFVVHIHDSIYSSRLPPCSLSSHF